jgi:ubiquitin-like 1-activating enzyme E1 B
MAGNIIPAIATTNAIIAGLVVMQATNLLSRNLAKARNVHLRTKPEAPLGHIAPVKPDPTCAVCRDLYVSFKADPMRVTLGTFVNEVVKKWLVSELEDGEDLEFSINEGPRILADPDFEDNFEKTLAELDIGRGKIITVRDEDDKYRPVQFCVAGL